MIRKYDFPILWSKNIRQVGDLYDCAAEPPRLLDRDSLNKKFSLKIDFLRFHQLKMSLEKGAKKVNYKTYNPALSDTFQPRLPLLIKIGNVQAKGCSLYYHTFRSRFNCLRNSSKSENKWHTNLDSTLSVTFWDRILKLPKKFLVPNKIIWTHIQINKHLLPTNYTVNHYDQSVSPLCSFCSLHPEKLYFLFWDCPVVREFWDMIANLIANFDQKFALGRKEALFGHAQSGGETALNTILALARYFIWKQKFTTKILDEVNFINFTHAQLQTIFDCQKLKNSENNFLKDWYVWLDHFQVV